MGLLTSIEDGFNDLQDFVGGSNKNKARKKKTEDVSAIGREEFRLKNLSADEKKRIEEAEALRQRNSKVRTSLLSSGAQRRSSGSQKRSSILNTPSNTSILKSTGSAF